MRRQDLRNTYPFHACNPREHVACCRPRKLPRRTLWLRVLDTLARWSR